MSWKTWQPNPQFAPSPPASPDDYLLVPERPPSGLFGPRSPSPQNDNYVTTSPSPSPPPTAGHATLEEPPVRFWDTKTDIFLDDTVPVVNDVDGPGGFADYVEGLYDFTGLYERLQASSGSTSYQIIAGVQENNLEGSSNIKEPTRKRRIMLEEPEGDKTDSDKAGSLPHKRRRLGGDEIKALDWTRFVEPNIKNYIGGGGYGDVYEGKWKGLPPEEDVNSPPRIVIKTFRVAPTDPAIEDKIKRIYREIAVWHVLKNENIVPFVGVYRMESNFPCLVSEWMFNGCVQSYINKTPSVCLHMIALGVARGLQFLHDYFPQIIHGDLKAENVLINRQGNPSLCDFGLSRILSENSLWITCATHAGGTTRWMSPELLDASQPIVTVESDAYAYGMTCYEIMKGLVPFHEYAIDAMVIAAVLVRKDRPKRDAKCIPDDIWKLMESCWADDLVARPKTSQILEILEPHACVEDSSLCIFRDKSQTPS